MRHPPCSRRLDRSAGQEILSYRCHVCCARRRVVEVVLVAQILFLFKPILSSKVDPQDGSPSTYVLSVVASRNMVGTASVLNHESM